MQISDELGKQDLYAETVVNKMSNNLSALLDRDSAALEKSLTINSGTFYSSPSPFPRLVHSPHFPPAPITEFLKRFQWNEAKFPIKNSVRDLVDAILKQFGEIDADMKSKMSAYSNAKTTLANLERKQT